MYTSSSSARKTIARNPSHLGSKRNGPSAGRSSAIFASIGSTGGATAGAAAARRAAGACCERGEARGAGMVLLGAGKTPGVPAPGPAGRALFDDQRVDELLAQRRQRPAESQRVPPLRQRRQQQPVSVRRRGL